MDLLRTCYRRSTTLFLSLCSRCFSTYPNLKPTLFPFSLLFASNTTRLQARKLIRCQASSTTQSTCVSVTSKRQRPADHHTGTSECPSSATQPTRIISVASKQHRFAWASPQTTMTMNNHSLAGRVRQWDRSMTRPPPAPPPPPQPPPIISYHHLLPSFSVGCSTISPT